MEDIINIQNKVCIVTGAGKGIGRVTAQRLASLGCRIAVMSRTREDLETLEVELKNMSSDALFFTGDCADSTDVDNFMGRVVEKFGTVDVLINNAGMRFRKPFLEISLEEWREVHRVNIESAVLFSQAVIPLMKKSGGGSIINMSSIVGKHGLAELSGYASTKGALISLTKTLALEFASDNIRVNVIAPGFCETSYTDNFKKNTELYQFTLDRTPLGRWGKSQDIANACVYLSSDLSEYVTGEIITVDGGWSAW